MTGLQSTGAATTRAARYRQHETPPLAERFFGKGQMIALTLAIVLVFVLLFPRELIDQQLADSSRPDAAAIAYLQLLLNARPSDNHVRLQLARAHLDVGQLRAAETTLHPLVVRHPDDAATVAALSLHMHDELVAAAPPHSAQREHERAAYARALKSMTARLDPRDQLNELHRAIAAGLYDTAAQLATHLLTSLPPANTSSAHPGAHVSDHAPAGRGTPPTTGAVEHVRGDLVGAGIDRLPGLIWATSPALTHAPQLNRTGQNRQSGALRAQAFKALLDSHLAANQPKAALSAAQHYVGTVDPARVDWEQLIRIADWAGNPAAAAGFAQHWLDGGQDQTTRWAAFHALVNAYLAAGQPVQALAVARAHITDIAPSLALWRFMTKLALQAGDADQSAYYAERLVHIKAEHAY